MSFVVIGKNENWRLEKCLSAIKRLADSELDQHHEIIYVDSQSTDNSIEIAKKYADKVFLITGECNAAIGRNIGAKEAEGDILFFLDGDMELRDEVLPTIITRNGRLHYPLMAGIEYDILFDNEWNKKEERPRRAFTPGRERVETIPSMGGMFVIEKPVWNTIGGMDCRLMFNEDYDFGFRSSEKGYQLYRVGKLWVNHYTRYYASRTNSTKAYRYSAMLMRKYCMKKKAYKKLFSENYSTYLLIMTIMLWGTNHYFYMWLPYILILLYRSFRTLQRTKASLNWFGVLFRRIEKDIMLIYHFITFYPKQPKIIFKRIK